MYKIRHLNCSTSSVHSGIDSFSMRGRSTVRLGYLGHNRARGIPSDIFARFTSPYIKIPILFQDSPPLTIGITLCTGRPCIQCATSLAISTTTLPPQPLLALSYLIMLRLVLLPLPVPIRFPLPHLPHFMSTKASRPCHRLTTPTRLIREPPIASAFLLPHQIQPPPVQYEKLSPQV